MKLDRVVALVTGGASGLGEAVVRAVVAKGGKAAILDLIEDKGKALCAELSGSTIFCKTDVASEADVSRAIAETVKKFGTLNVAVNCAGIAPAAKTTGSKGPAKLEMFETVIRVNLTGSFNVIRLAAHQMSGNQPNDEGERGVLISTASAAAFDGQIGQAAYAASKAGVVGMTLPISRDLGPLGIRNMTIAPGTFATPMMLGMPDAVKESLAKMVPFPQRLGRPEEFAALVLHIIENVMMNGETIRLDGAIRMPAK